MRYSSAILIVVLLLSSCLRTGKLPTASGRPEITVLDATMEAVRDQCVAVALREGFVVESTSEYSISLTKPGEGEVYVTGYRKPLLRAIFNIVNSDGRITVYHRMAKVYSEESAQQVVFLDSQRDFDEQQARLNRILEELRK